jgi:HSP20 family molecular chaperone IbpA
MAKKSDELVTFPLHLPREVERLFDEMIHRPWGFCRDVRGWNPSIDVYETDTAFVLEADLPGVNSQDVRVECDNGDLVLQGSRTIEERRTEGQFHTMERCSGSFLRRIKLPDSVDREEIHAEFKDGVLRVTLPKRSTRARGERR